AQHNGQRGQSQTQFVREEAPQDNPLHQASSCFMCSSTEVAVGARSSSTTSPSARNTTRSAKAAPRASWVTMTIDCCSSVTDRRRNSNISVDELESRFPVGSSAKIR